MRDLNKLKRGHSGCCPGHDEYPTGSYKGRKSKKARAKGKQAEHQYVRTLQTRQLQEEIKCL